MEQQQQLSESLQQFLDGKSTNFTYFLTFSLSLWATRIVLLKTLVGLGRSSLADQTRITKRPVINEKQHERESVWPLGYFLDVVAKCLMFALLGLFDDMPFVRQAYLTDFLWNVLYHCTVVEFLYYWLHVGLHWQPLYKAWHQYHHKSINTEPTTALSFEIGERLTYTALFAVAPICSFFGGNVSYFGFFSYILWFDFMNEGGHINFEIFPPWFFRSPLKYIFYSPTYHAAHHTKFKKNYSLFMPWPDMLFGTVLWGVHPSEISSTSSTASVGSSSTQSPQDDI